MGAIVEEEKEDEENRAEQLEVGEVRELRSRTKSGTCLDVSCMAEDIRPDRGQARGVSHQRKHCS